MGRSLHFYAIPDSITHDTTKPICMGLDYERTLDEAKECLHEHLNGKKEYKDFREELEHIEKTWKEFPTYRYEKYERIPSEAWCPWCAVFSGDELYESPLIKASIGFNNSYSNPIWRSDWHFYNMYPGQTHTDLLNRFSNEHMYRQIFDRDVENIEYSLGSLGIAYCTSDKEGLEATQRTIEFCKKWLAEPGIAIIYHSET